MNEIDPKLISANSETVSIQDYDSEWVNSFQHESEFLNSVLPPSFVKRVEHFGSTAVPGLAAKPIIDMLVEVDDVSDVRKVVTPILKGMNYDYIWRPTFGSTDGEPYYAWFIKRGQNGCRTHHIHMVEESFPHWDRLVFRDYLIDHPEAAKQYGLLKRKLAQFHPNDRTAYTVGKSEFIANVMEKA